jgi:methionine sulfoxide reductase heme-binding subunit
MLPLVIMLRPLYAQPPDLQKDAGDVLGLGAILCLLACLSITPLMRVTNLRGANTWRKWYGLSVFILGFAGLAIAVSGGPVTTSKLAIQGPAGHIGEWTGTVIVFLLVPLALTSAKLAQQLLGKYWKIWQRYLMWAVWAMLAVHLAILRNWIAEIAYLMASGPLILARFPAVRNDITRWKRQGYSDSHIWILAGMALAIYVFGVATLVYMEVAASARATWLT